MKQTETTILLSLGENHAPEKIKSTTRLITNWNGKYYRGLETEDFIFFVNYQEGDENGCVMMYRKSDLTLASCNYFAYSAMFEVLTDTKDWTYISKSMKNNLKLYNEANA